ncbi:MAG TPA: ATP/GTP-binding protein [Thermoanaerobaculia bacterium]
MAFLLAVSVAATATGFEKPESACWDAGSRSWYVSNISGGENEKDGQGWISRLDPGGKVVNARWVEGLNAPKGIRVRGRTLYVSDVDQLVVIDMRNARVKTRIDAPGAKFLNDVEVGRAGEVYVSDTLKNAIYRCREKCEVFLESEELEGPNGLLVVDDRLIVAAWGLVTDPATFATKTPGRLLAVDLKTKAITPLGDGKPLGNLDGLERDGADYLVSDFMAGKLFRVSKSGAVTVLKDGFKNSADIGFDSARRVVAVPEMEGGDVQLLRIGR